MRLSEYYLSIDDSGNAIMHHGVKGMKWGQHIFGKVKTAYQNHRVRKREAKEEAKARKHIEKEQAARRASLAASDPSKMTDEELKSAMARIQLEKTYLDTRNAVLSATEKQQSRGQKVMNNIKDQLATSLTDAAKRTIANTIDEKVTSFIEGKVNPDRQKKEQELKDLQLDSDIWSKKKAISDAQKQISRNNEKPAEKSKESKTNDELRTKLSNEALNGMLNMINKGSYNDVEFDRLAKVAGYKLDDEKKKKK